jgi:hypothetical protein
LVNKKELPHEPLHPVHAKTAEAPSIRE